MKTKQSLLLFISSLLLSHFVSAAPHPATSSSVLTDPEKGILFHGFGFRINNPRTDWIPTPVLTENPLEVMRFEPRNADQKEAAITLHFEKMRSPQTLEAYARKWMKEYSSYGFEVLGTKGVLLNGERSLLIDLTQNKKNRQLRQAVLQKDNRILVVTCLDRKDTFQDTLAACNSFLKGLEWVSEPKLDEGPSL